MDAPQVTLDLSHTAASGSDALAMAEELGDRLAHVHMADGTGVPWAVRTSTWCPAAAPSRAPVLEKLTADGYPGMVVLEVNTRRATTREARLADLAPVAGASPRGTANLPRPAAWAAQREQPNRAQPPRMDAGRK